MRSQVVQLTANFKQDSDIRSIILAAAQPTDWVGSRSKAQREPESYSSHVGER